MLTDDEIDRYARHLVLKEIGGQGQLKLKAAKVALVGMGGIGAPAALYLAAAGIGHLGLIDDDTVSLSNLQRQVLWAAVRTVVQLLLVGQILRIVFAHAAPWLTALPCG